MDLEIKKVNGLYVKIISSQSIMMELYDHFAYFAKGYKHMPKYKAGIWDGKIRLYSLSTKQIYAGLLDRVIKFAKANNYTYSIDENIKRVDYNAQLKQFFKEDLKHISVLVPHDYQKLAMIAAIVENKSLILSPTASGKSLVIYLIINFIKQYIGGKILVVVPTVALTSQMVSDFDSYHPDKDFSKHCHKIYSGQEKNTDALVTCTTWQSVFRLDKNWFNQFDHVIIDEAHQANAQSISGIIDKMPDAKIRTGLTGTLDGTSTHELFMNGVFGKIFKAVTTKELMDSGKVAELKIDVVRLKYNHDDCKLVSKLDYEKEITFLIENDERNTFLVNTCLKSKGNTLMLFNFVEGHGEKLYNRLIAQAEQYNKIVYIVHGGIGVEERESIRKSVETADNIIIVASYGVFRQGVNMKNLHNVIFAHPYKNRIRNLQSIGRALRLSSTKDAALLIDICDDLCVGKKQNMTFIHALERMKIYESEQFNYKTIEVNMKGRE